MAPRPRDGESDAELLRVFFGIEVDESARDAAVEIVGALRASPGGEAVSWVRPESLHVTLRFLGEIEADRIPELVRRVSPETAVLASFRIRLGGVRPFPSARRPVAIVLDVAPVEPLEELAEAVERGVVAAGFAPESRPFRAHLTLGRVRTRRFPSAGSAMTPGSAAWDVSGAVLFRSELGRSGARYNPLERLSLQTPRFP